MAKGDYLYDDWGEPTDAHERIALQWLQKHSGTSGQTVMESLATLLRYSVTTERERCAKIVEDESSYWTRETIAAAIRRGE